MPREVIKRLQNLYMENVAVVVVNNIPGKSIKNVLLSLIVCTYSVLGLTPFSTILIEV